MRASYVSVLAIAGAVAAPAAQAGSWLQWGGPNRNFILPASGTLATRWPASGPKQLWSRALGEGHSAIVAEHGRLYTMYRPAGWVRRQEEEVVTAIDAASGKAIWEHKYAAPTAGLDFQYGAGPHATPLIAGTRLFAASTLKQLFAFDKQSGKVLWSHDAMKEFGAPRPGRGFSPSPIVYEKTVILPIGGPGQAVM
ncbi:MAG: PQQ-like beta-propeller repeat protein, partial [Acidobacteria bacterium]|nr:PQQ-like beta-propeller repeat protein [Acidobacteriota bacterium]